MKWEHALSLCMIIRDEEKFLPDFIEKHKNFFDEWIVVDTGSSDASIDILEASGISPLSYVWENDFSKARNYALRQATGQWVASFDADEIMSADEQLKIKEIIEKKSVDAISVILRNYSDDIYDMMWLSCSSDPASLQPLHKRMPGYIPVPLIRFFRNKPEYCWQYPIHELIQPSIDKAGGTIVETDCIIHHYGFGRSTKRRDRKKELYRHIANELKQGSAACSPKILCELGRATEDEAERLSLFQKALDLSPGNPFVMAFLGDAQLEAGRMHEALNTADNLIKQNPDKPGGYLLAAKCYYRLNEPARGIALLKSSLPNNDTNPNILYSLGMLYFIAGDIKASLFNLRRAHKLAPTAEAIEKDLKKVEELASRYNI